MTREIFIKKINTLEIIFFWFFIENNETRMFFLNFRAKLSSYDYLKLRAYQF